jgi:hypothetical protein
MGRVPPLPPTPLWGSTTWLSPCGALLSKIAAICLFREMFEEADPQLL